MVGGTSKPILFVEMSGEPRSKQQRKEAYSRVQGHLARVGHIKRKQKADIGKQLTNSSDLPVHVAETAKWFNASPDKPSLTTKVPTRSSKNPDEVESETEDDEQSVEGMHNRDVEQFGQRQAVRLAYWRQRTFQFASLAYIRRSSSDPFYCFAKTDPVDIYSSNEFFWDVTVPSHSTLAHAFNMENHWGACLSSTIREPIYWYCAASLLSVVRNGMFDYRVRPSPQIFQYLGLALETFRERLHEPGAFSDNLSILVTLYLVELAYRLRDYQSCKVHQTNLRKMVDHRGGLETLGVGGRIKGVVLDYDSYWLIETGKSTFPEARPVYKQTYISDKLPSSQQALLQLVPKGFLPLILQKKLSLEITTVISRINNTALGRPHSPPASPGTRTDEPSPLKSDIFASCPSLSRLNDSDSELDLEQAISLANVLFFCRAFMSHRTVFGKYNGVRTRLTKGLPAIDFSLPPTERAAWSWIWMVAVESWRTARGVLEPEGESLLKDLYRATTAHTHLSVHDLDKISRNFFWNDNLSRSFGLSWDNTDRRAQLRAARLNSRPYLSPTSSEDTILTLYNQSPYPAQMHPSMSEGDWLLDDTVFQHGPRYEPDQIEAVDRSGFST